MKPVSRRNFLRVSSAGGAGLVMQRTLLQREIRDADRLRACEATLFFANFFQPAGFFEHEVFAIQQRFELILQLGQDFLCQVGFGLFASLGEFLLGVFQVAFGLFRLVRRFGRIALLTGLA